MNSTYTDDDSMDLLCQGYESALRANRSPRIQSYLQKVSQVHQPLLLARLIYLERQLLSVEEIGRRCSQLVAELPQFTPIIVDGFSLREVATDQTTINDPLGSPALGTDSTNRTMPLKLNDYGKIGPYQLLEPIGEGGMGSVWKAEQIEPVRRCVAVKIIKLGLSSKEIFSRFDAERQALAMMNHPCIARILDAGTTEQGQPYFAMELVSGLTLTRYCDQHRLTLNQRLQLFTQVCDAVQHAHQKGILHRDLKPGNILVAQYDGQPLPKVIDFGLAKALEAAQRLTDQTVVTEFGQVLGTLKYMSPEQAGLDSLDIDTRSDIYSLGVILYELLTGFTPLDNDVLRGQSLVKVLEHIRQQDTPRPSSRLNTGNHETGKHEALTAITEKRQTDVRKLSQILVGDLDWIVMKAIEKDRSRRYESASSLAADLQRYLDGEPVQARPPSAGYRMQKFVRKHRLPVYAAGTMFATLVIGIIGTTIGLREARSARLIADQRASDLDKLTKFQTKQFAKISLDSMGNRIRQELLQQSQAKPNQPGLTNERLTAINFTDVASDTFAEHVVKPALEAIKQDLGNQPAVKAAMLHSVAEIAYKVGLTDLCAEPQREALDIRKTLFGVDHPDTIESLLQLGLIYQLTSGDSHALIAQAAAASERVFGVNDERTLNTLNNLAESFRQSGNTEAAQVEFERVLERAGAQSEARIRAMTGMGSILSFQGKSNEAEQLFEAAITAAEAIYPQDSQQVISMKAWLAWLLQNNHQAERAEKIFRETYAISARTLGDSHGDTIDSLKGVGESLAEQAKFEEAREVFERCLELATDHLGRSHQLTIACLSNKARVLVELGKAPEAKEIFAEALELSTTVFGPKHPATLEALSDMGLCCLELQQLSEAEAMMTRSWQASSEVLGPDDVRTTHRAGVLQEIQRRNKAQ